MSDAYYEAIREEDESMQNAAQLAREGRLLQHDVEPAKVLNGAPETHSILKGPVYLECHKGSFYKNELECSDNEHDKLAGTKHEA